MSGPLPHRPSPDHTPSGRELLDLADDDAGAIIESLGSETPRAILRALGDGPTTMSDLAERVDTSLQNVQYHLGRLSDAGLVDDVGTWYSVKGCEMDVYALTTERLEIHVGAAGPSESPRASRRGPAD